MIKTIFSITILFICVFSRAQIQNIPLHSNWTFQCDSMEKPLPATVPGNCYLDLMDHGIIPDVYFGDNADKYQWPGEIEFVYTMKFDFDEIINEKTNIDLVFYGLDTYASIYLNNSLVQETNNMFIQWEIPVQKLLKNQNELKIVFHPAVEIAIPIKEAYPYDLPADSDHGEQKTSIFTRKAGYHYGWDFAPRFTGCGIWKPVELRIWEDARIENVYYRTVSIKNNKAKMKATCELNWDAKGEYKIKISGFNQKLPILDTIYHIGNEWGDNILRYEFELENPSLWWPNGIGEANLYPAKIELLKDGVLIDSDERNIGIRTIDLVQTKDSIGESFYFRVNGEKIFAQGANWVPPDMFLSPRDSGKYENLIALAHDAHFNMLRVWGGGVYADDYFYELCDQNGILVWQDFMFSCAFYPFDNSIANNLSHEAPDNVVRIRNHPSLALWCGNNEIDEAWHNWGYQEKYNWSEEDSVNIWSQYKGLFHDFLPEVLLYNDPATDYITTSPKYGWGRPQSMTHGDSHYWGVWWGNQPFEIYKEKTGRFMSEFGFQALPDETTLMKMSGKVNSIWNPQWKTHQKHPTGFETINTYMEREFNIPEDPYDYAYLSQILQARGLSVAFISHREKEWCDGSLFWQFNEPWPGINWSAVDYFGKPKALYYEAKRCLAPQYVYAEEKNDTVYINLLNSDILKKGELQVSLFNTDGEELYSEKVFLSFIKKDEVLAKYPSQKFTEMGEKQDLILYFRFSQQGILLSENFHAFLPLGELNLKEPEFSFESCASQRFILRTKRPALYVHPVTDKIQTDDYFILMPGYSKKVSSEMFLTLKSLFDVFD